MFFSPLVRLRLNQQEERISSFSNFFYPIYIYICIMNNRLYSSQKKNKISMFFSPLVQLLLNQQEEIITSFSNFFLILTMKQKTSYIHSFCQYHASPEYQNIILSSINSVVNFPTKRCRNHPNPN